MKGFKKRKETEHRMTQIADSTAIEPVFRWWLALLPALAWSGLASGEDLLLGAAGVSLACCLIWWSRVKRNGQPSLHLPLACWLAAGALLTTSPQPALTWWVAGLHGAGLVACGATPVWKAIGLLVGFAGLGAPGQNFMEYAFRAAAVMIGLISLWQKPSERRARSSEAFEPVAANDAQNKEQLVPALNLYLQNHLPQFQADGAIIYQYNLQSGRLEPLLLFGSLPEAFQAGNSLTLEEGCAGVCAAYGKTVAYLSLLKPPKDLPVSLQWEGRPTICAPLFDPASTSGKAMGALQIFGSDLQARSVTALQQMAARITESLTLIRAREAEQVANFQRLSAIVEQVEEQSPHTRGHSRRVAQLCQFVAADLGLEPELTEKLATAALFHDIGKTRVPSEILNKEGALTDEEKTLIRQYPHHSVDICADMGLDEDTLFLIRHHGERLDGSGYPDQLDASRQPLALRILSAVDVFDTLACTRVYRQSLTMEERLAELARQAGSRLDMMAVETLRRAYLRGQLETIYPAENETTQMLAA